MKTIAYNNKVYPAFQASGNAKRFIEPFAKEFCKGHGVDVGCSIWPIEGAIAVDNGEEFNALHLPHAELDYVFSSHCLEHIPDWVAAANHWVLNLKATGTLFLYLPDFSQTYWRPWHNRKHVNAFTPEIIKAYLTDKFKDVHVSGVDLNSSFAAVGENKL